MGAGRPPEGPHREDGAGRSGGRAEREGAEGGPAQVPFKGGGGPEVQLCGACGSAGLRMVIGEVEREGADFGVMIFMW